MQTKLSRYTEALMEAVWLAALIVVPVFFNVYSSRIFEPDKIALMRTLTLLGLGAWVVRLFEQGRVEWGEHREAGENWFRALLRIPLMPAVLSLVAAYLIATVFSVTPRISFWGSYQRLQGTYTLLSYLMVFGMVAATLRRREQVDRLITTVILASLPVGLYGIIQKFGIDPVPWGGDTTGRVAANMGNAIFVAAYLILPFPLTIGRIVDAFSNILGEEETHLTAQVARGTVYVFAAAIQLITIYFSLSRGPILGLLAGTFFMFILLSLYWGKRWLTLSTVVVAAALGVFLVVLSLPNGPLQALRSNDNIGRLGNIFETEGGTGRVRVLIWEGAAKLTSPHPPISFPDGSPDPVNFLRPLIGYGPESMYVAYNPFYPPELANIESRNASPDRSHNETWDALVITGLLGLLAEQAVFLSVFYYGLKWLGLVTSKRQRGLFFGLILSGGVLSAAAFAIRAGIGFLGVGLPFGMLLGLLAYLTLVSVFTRYQTPQTEGERARALTLMMFLGAIISHYVEIHFGIAIAASRLYFWTFAGVLLAVGYVMTRQGVYGAQAQARLTGGVLPEGDTAPPSEPAPNPKKSRKGTRRSPGEINSPEKHQAWSGGLIAGIILAALTFNYIGNSARITQIGKIIWGSLTSLPNKGVAVSYGILAIFLTSLLAASVVFTAEWSGRGKQGWRRMALMVAGVGLVTWLVYSFMQANGLVGVIQASVPVEGATGTDMILRQAVKLEGLITEFYAVVAALVFWLAWHLMGVAGAAGRDSQTTGRGALAALGVFLVVAIFSWQANLRVIHADIAFKMGDPFARGSDTNNWRAAVLLYQRANNYAPSEDHYYLFLGRGYLELARLVQGQNPSETAQLMADAERDLKRAQTINPLNTDHTANLARLYRFWSATTPTADESRALILRASEYYASAVLLSPQNAVIWNEWGSLYMQLGETDLALEKLAHSLEIDPFYNETYALLGDFYVRQARQAVDEASKAAAIEQAVGYFTGALSRTSDDDTGGRYFYLTAIASAYTEINKLNEAIVIYQQALAYANSDQLWRVEDTLAKIFLQLGGYENALKYANYSLNDAPEEQKAAQQQLITYIESQQGTPAP